jgi:cytochrome b involved in lipid metabolism
VYDLTSFVARHPGGSARIISLCGTDGTAAFTGQHAGSSAALRALGAYQIDGTGSVARPSASTGATGSDANDDDQGEDGDQDREGHGGRHDEDD